MTKEQHYERFRALVRLAINLEQVTTPDQIGEIRRREIDTEILLWAESDQIEALMATDKGQIALGHAAVELAENGMIETQTRHEMIRTIRHFTAPLISKALWEMGVEPADESIDWAAEQRTNRKLDDSERVKCIKEEWA
jgi:hypothetical protein